MDKDAKTLILEFNSNPENRKLQAFYERKAIMEIFGKARDEESHSSFLAWLLEGKDLTANHSDSPLMWLLQILVLREETVEAKKDPIPREMKAQILSRTLEFKIEKVKTEEVVNNALTRNYFKCNFNSKGNEDGQDRLDIYIKCSLTDPSNCGGYESFEIFIENKVLSSEGGAKPESNQVFVKDISFNNVEHDELKQTERYYNALSYCNAVSNLQFFVFLAPENHDLSESKNFFQVSYQDILDYILTPLIQNEDLSERSRVLIQDYIDGLSIPTLDTKENKRIVMAVIPTEKESIERFKSKNKDLIISCLNALAKMSLNQNQNKQKITITNDDMILAKFAKENKNLLFAVLADSTKDTTVDYLNQLLEGTLSQSLFIVYNDEQNNKNNYFKICNNSSFGFEFARIFAKKHSACNTSKLLNNEIKKELGKKMTVYYDKSSYDGFDKNKQNKYKQLPDTSIYVTTNNWDIHNSTGLLSRLLGALEQNKPDYFKYKKIPFD